MKHELSAREKQQLDALKDTLGALLDSRAKFELLNFWAWHPSGWSSPGAVAPKSSLPRIELHEALLELVDAGLVKTKRGTDICFYAMDSKHPAYAAILQLGRLTPRRRRYLMRNVRASSSVVEAQAAS
jgi:hypothetical protein